MDLTRTSCSHPELLAALQPEERDSIEHGGVIVRAHPEASSEQPVVLGIAAMSVERRRGWALFANWDYVHDFVPAAQMQVIERRETGAIQYLSTHAQLRLGPVRLQFTLNVRFDSEHYVQTWSLASSAQVAELRRVHSSVRPNSDLIRGSDGRISCSVYPGGRTLLVYEGLLTPSPLLPRFAEQFITRRSVHMLLAGYADYFVEHTSGDLAPPGRLLRPARTR